MEINRNRKSNLTPTNMYLHEDKLTLIFNTELSNFNPLYKCPNSKLEYTLAEYEYDLHDANSLHK